MILLFLFSISGSVQQPPPPFSPPKGRQIEKVSGLHCSFAYYGRFVGRQAGRQAEHLTERTPLAHCTAPHKPDRPSTSHTTRTHKHILFLLAFVFLSLPPLPRNSCGKLETFLFFLLFLLSFTFPHNPYPPPSLPLPQFPHSSTFAQYFGLFVLPVLLLNTCFPFPPVFIRRGFYILFSLPQLSLIEGI